jgi:hypothetical protein
MAERSSELKLTLRALLLCQLRLLTVGEQMEILLKAGWTSPQVASITGMKPDAVRKRRSRSKER